MHAPCIASSLWLKSDAEPPWIEDIQPLHTFSVDLGVGVMIPVIIHVYVYGS